MGGFIAHALDGGEESGGRSTVEAQADGRGVYICTPTRGTKVV